MASWFRKIQVDPIIRPGVEVAITALFTFAPIALISFPFVDSSTQTQNPDFSTTFWSYWNSGEIALPILGLCGALFGATTLNREAFSRYWISFSLILTALIVMTSSYIIGTTKGFSADLFPYVITAGFFVYGVLLIMLWITSILNAFSPKEHSSSDERAKELLAAKNSGN